MPRSLARLVDEGKVKPLIDERRFTLDTALDAHRYLESGRLMARLSSTSPSLAVRSDKEPGRWKELLRQ